MEWKYGEITQRVIACAMEVHRVLGPGFPECVYARALNIEFQAAGVFAEQEFPLPLFFKGHRLTVRRIDFLVEQLVGLELKARSDLQPSDFVQALNYIKAWNIEVGMLINFGASSLQFRRLDNRHFDALLATQTMRPEHDR